MIKNGKVFEAMKRKGIYNKKADPQSTNSIQYWMNQLEKVLYNQNREEIKSSTKQKNEIEYTRLRI